MKINTIRGLVIGICAVMTLGGAFAVPAAPWLHGVKEPVRDILGNRHLRDSRAPITLNGRRLVGAAVPTTGTVRLLAIPVEFAIDTDPLTTGTGRMPYRTWGPAADTSYLQNRLQAVRDYFTEISHGQVTVVPTLTAKVTLAKPMADYSADVASNDFDRALNIMRDVVTAGDAAINFADADIIMLIHAGAGQEMNANSKDIWSHSISGASINTNDGVTIDGYTVMPETQCTDAFFKLANPTINVQQYELNPNPSQAFIPHYWDVQGVWVHELCHQFGMPDVYDVNYSTGLSLDYWSVMASGSYLPMPADSEGQPWTIPYSATRPNFGSIPCHPDAWCKKLVGWTTVTNVDGQLVSEHIVGQGQTAAKVYRMWTDGDATSTEYFLLEARTHSGYDRYTPETGLMIYHIDDMAGDLAANELQIDASHPRIYPVSADNKLEKDSSGVYIPGVNTAFPSTLNNTHFGQDTTPNNSDWTAVPTTVDVSNITVNSTDVVADLSTVLMRIVFVSPRSGETVYVRRLTIHAGLYNIDPTTVSVDIDGTALPTPSYNQVSKTISFGVGPLSIGRHVITASGRSFGGGITLRQQLAFSYREFIMPSGKSLISLPVTDIGAATDVFPGIASLQMAWWNPASEQYQYYPNPAVDLANPDWAAVDRVSSETCAPAGRAFWVNLPTACPLRLEGEILQSDHQYIVPLRRGFNMIGNPYTYAVAFGSILVSYNGRQYSLEEAVAAQLIEPVLYWWDRSGYQLALLPQGELQPWIGYWVYARVGTSTTPLQLIFQPAPIIQNMTAASTTRQQQTPMDWLFTVKAAGCSDLQAQANVTLGVLARATDRYDTGIDIMAPPAGPDNISLAATGPHGELPLWRDVRAPEADAAHIWTLMVSGQPGAQITLTWPDLTELPHGYHLVLQDSVSGEERYLRTAPNYVLTLGPQERQRQLILTATLDQPGLLRIQQLRGQRQRAIGAYTITYSLTQSATATMEIRTMTGRIIRRFPPAVQGNGIVTVSWDGKDQQGRVIPRGMYQCRVHAVTHSGVSTNAVTLLPY